MLRPLKVSFTKLKKNRHVCFEARYCTQKVSPTSHPLALNWLRIENLVTHCEFAQWPSHGGGVIRAMPPPQANHRRPTYLSTPRPKPGPLDQLGPLADFDFLPGFRAPRDGSGSRNTNQGPAGRIRALQYEAGAPRPHFFCKCNPPK